MFSTNFLFFVFIFMTMQVSTYLLSYVQTLRNIISFAFLALCISFGLGLTYGVQYYPLFILLTYVGAIIVSTLYVVLTFDIRNEYKQKVSHVDNFWSIIGVTNIIDGVFCLSWLLLRRVTPDSSEVGPSYVSHDELKIAYDKCVSRHPDLLDVCKNHFLETRDRSMINNILDYTNDLNVVSTNFYTNYSFLFIFLAIMLSVALVAALAILKHR